jgi:hypothetical protein
MFSPTDFVVSRHPERVVTILRGEATPKYSGAHLRAKRESYVLRWIGMAMAIGVFIALLVLIRFLTHRG